ncbi:amino-acid acetyltransferase, mitochondrial [Kwoniella heveanensis BCC8398]|uniref:Amino-acid acetyltransferase, mitochondrial n=1 Tax=Kwoniella heveanensis BCC8398 TaxID=1296120 RepID=A0A1B9GQL6_9TREE|nr:amino-acid acetyltransferase, mitochondrial [Kwoniella heveanensis BCC8398]
MRPPIHTLLAARNGTQHALTSNGKRIINKQARSSLQIPQARYRHDSQVLRDIASEDNDFILSILQASPSVRDSRSYLSSFAPPPSTSVSPSTDVLPSDTTTTTTTTTTTISAESSADAAKANPLVNSLLDPILRRPALVKIQGPFTDAQLDSICRGMAHLQKLGLVSVIVVDRDDLPSTESKDRFEAQRQRAIVRHEVERVVHFLGRHRAVARPIFSTVARISETQNRTQGQNTIPGKDNGEKQAEVFVEEEGLDHVRRAVREGEIPVLLPVALDEGCRSRRISSNRVLLALASAMSGSGSGSGSSSSSTLSANAASSSSSTIASNLISASASTSASDPSTVPPNSKFDLTPVRLLIINREGGIPSYARQGLPHLSINLASEYTYITRTFLPQWRESHPTSLSNLSLANGCLAHMPKESSALVVSHRSPAAMIANLITNKPAHSASLPHSLLVESEGRITRDTPTLLRKGLPVRVLRSLEEVDQGKLTKLLETSFRRKLDKKKYYDRLRRDLDFVIVVGDYAGAAVCTLEGKGEGAEHTPAAIPALDSSSEKADNNEPICYLDKFAVHPSHQGDGTVDFLWVALRDETYGLGLLDASNPSIGSLRGVGVGRDLVWRSRADNPVNKWYFERSSGFVRTPDGRWKVFWCDAEQRLKELWREREFGGGRLVRVVEDEEKGRVERWEREIGSVPSAWAA